MKFRQPNKSIKVCLYKVIFDEKKIARSFYWSPKNTCPLKQVVARQKVIIQQPKMQMVHKKITLDVDALFNFDEYRLESMLPEGRERLDLLVSKLKEYGKKGDVRIYLTGYTDRMGQKIII